MSLRRILAALAIFLTTAPVVYAAPPPNDSYAAAQSIPTGTTTGTTVEATSEVGEPIYLNSDTTVWYKWTANVSGWMRATTVSTSATLGNVPRVTVMEGTTLENLAIVSRDVPGSSLTRFNAVSGRQYYFHVTENDSPGPFSLALSSITAPAPPTNDNFAGVIALAAALPRSLAGTFVDASVELREPDAYDSDGRSTVWYRWTPTTSRWVDIYLETSANAVFNVYTGTSLATLTPVPPRFLDEASLTAYYQVTSGTTYYLQLIQETGASRDFTVNIDPLPTPAPSANDSFASSLSLGNAASVNLPEQDNSDATTESSEPRPLTSLTSTLWYSWTAPVSGTVEIKTVGGPNHDTFLGIYTGTTLASLSTVAFDDDIDVDADNYDSSVVLSVTAGTIYRIQVGSAYAGQDEFTLTIQPVDADLQPFRVTAFTASASTVNLTSAPATVTFDVTLSDALQDLDDMSLNLEAPSSVAPWGVYPASRFLEGSSPPVLVSGLIYRFTRTLPAELPAGAYTYILDINDTTGGYANDLAAYGGRDGVQLPGGANSLMVTNSGADLPPPVLTSLTINPATVNVTVASATVTLSVQATGIPVTRPVEVILTDTLGVDAVFNSFFLLHDGTKWTTTLTVQKGTLAGIFRPTVVLYGETLGRNYGYADALASTLPAGSPESFTVTNTSPDRLPPQLRAFTRDATSLNLYAGDVLLSGTCRLVDASQVDDFEIGFDNGSFTSYPSTRLTQLSGNSQDGIYRWSFLVPAATTVSGSYSLTVLAGDGAGNALEFATFYSTWPLGQAPGITIGNGQQETAETIWMSAQNFSTLPQEDQRFATAINTDPDRDGWPNLLEFHFGTNPANPDPGPSAANLPVVSRNGNVLQLAFGKSSANAALGFAGSSLTAQFSPDLLEWTDRAPLPTTPGFFRAESPALTTGKGYLRLIAQPVP